jgi:hypothetical protein
MEDHVTHDEQEPTAVENIEALFETVKVYGKTNLDLFKLKAAGKTAEIASSAVAAIAMCVMMIIFFAILSVGIALFLGELLGKNYYGFFALAGFYLITGLILFGLRKKIFKESIANSLIKKMFN